jgi:hypothetical protein
MRYAIITVLCLFAVIVAAQEPDARIPADTTLESVLGLEALPTHNQLVVTAKIPNITIWRQQFPVWSSAIEKKPWSWEPPSDDTDDRTERRRRRSRQEPTQPAWIKDGLDGVIAGRAVDGKLVLHPELAKQFMGGYDEVKLYAIKKTKENGDLLLGWIEGPSVNQGQRRIGNVVANAYVQRIAQLRIYAQHADHLELRFYEYVTMVRQRESKSLPPIQIGPTLILRSKLLGDDEDDREEKIADQVSPPAMTQRESVRDEPSPGRDVTLNPREGIPSEAPTPYRPTTSKVIRFSRPEDQVTVEKSIVLPDQFTMEAIVKAARRGLNTRVLACDGFAIQLDSNRDPVVLEAYPPNRLLFVHPTEFGRWYHLAIVQKSNSRSMFVNGRLTSQSDRQRGRSRGEPTVISAEPRPFTGDIQAIRISAAPIYLDKFDPPERLLTEAETIALWSAEHVRGDLWVDLSGNGHDGELRGAQQVDP